MRLPEQFRFICRGEAHPRPGQRPGRQRRRAKVIRKCSKRYGKRVASNTTAVWAVATPRHKWLSALWKRDISEASVEALSSGMVASVFWESPGSFRSPAMRHKMPLRETFFERISCRERQLTPTGNGVRNMTQSPVPYSGVIRSGMVASEFLNFEIGPQKIIPIDGFFDRSKRLSRKYRKTRVPKNRIFKQQLGR